ncbi:MAG: hypothetical protein ACTSXG_03065 [Alphaproteobacteria bacterium]
MNSNCKKRPILVRAVFIFYLFSSAFVLLAFYSIYFCNIPMDPARKAYIESFTAIDIVLSLIILMLCLTGAIVLFCLRKQAFYFFVFHLASSLMITVWYIFSKSFMKTLSIVGGWKTLFFGWGMDIIILLYIKKLEKRGILS